MSKFTITANSTPVFDEWGFDDYWSAADWMLWFDKLVEKHGKDGGKLLWIKGFTNPDAPWLGAAHGDWLDGIVGDAVFIDFLKENDLWDSVNSGIMGVWNDSTNLVTDGASDVINAGSNLVSSSANTINLISKVLPVIVIIVLIAVFMYYKKTIEIVS